MNSAKKQSLVHDFCFIAILFVVDIIFLSWLERPLLSLTRMGYFYGLFDRYAGWDTHLMAGSHVMVSSIARTTMLEYEIILLLILYSTLSIIRPWLQLSAAAWLIMGTMVIFTATIWLDGIALPWTVYAFNATLMSTIFCLWLGRKVGRAIA